jgi:ABC-2 type transport system ATP-binding protein
LIAAAVMDASRDAGVDVRGLSKVFATRAVLDDVSLRVARGEIVALLGPNGAGKTTTLRILAGLVRPSGGGGAVAGIALEGHLQRLRARVGLLTETPGLWDRLTVYDNLLTYARLYGVAAPESRVRTLLDQFGLAARAGDRAGVLSKGQRQRVALMRALVAEPAVLLLDEPTSGLDPDAARVVRDAIVAARNRGVAVLLSTHQLDEAAALADRIAVLQQRLLADDTPAGLARRLPGSGRVVIEVEGDARQWTPVVAAVAATVEASGAVLSLTLAAGRAVPDAVAALVGAGARVQAVREAGPALEAAYLSLVRRDG